MYFMNWHVRQPGAQYNVNVPNPKRGQDTQLLSKTAAALGIDLRALAMSGKVGPNSFPFLRIIAHADIFFDNSAPFEKFLHDNAESKAKSCDIRVRKRNNIHTRRLGIPLSKQQNKVPEVTPEEFYNIFTLGQADGPVRFVEFETCT
ncbi:hypothetical protein FIBSPDRAFT_243612 [Athelia psychrophila]|uniref:Uncharacterized protein n=1 Tax=Athelia psychrophila TaxID=1759441 RepID=A0A165Y129_9AGAM|nr:hypothetical protein FIBSPDRAFT_243612 [Fibularhizoctonia sp. CBS 109695]